MYLPRPAADGPAPSDKVITYVAFPETFPLQSSCMGVLCTSRRRQLQPWELGIFCDILEIQASRKPGGVFLVMGTQRGLAHRGCQVLRRKGLLHEWNPQMFVIFVSHQWLGAGSPDPSGQQMTVLRHALQSWIDGSMKVDIDLMRTFGDQSYSTTSYERVATGYLFLDWFAIPQLTERADGVNDDATVSDTARAVQSIPAYVESCDMFVALVPDLVHSDTGLQCNYSTWLSRG
ncbi:hypothetical protein AK812_SmicGene32806 [Symbiodinium microadriaticum]|uniref:Uncharacterized protein n=1 Tax=Symbiodinium microadriaticum TaxID=2951 RepID=A0A1Q9CT56_SYMMI|nr:hypothetical protein AK812_SmicGene32806 [Symbiodinium microadriaticum]